MRVEPCAHYDGRWERHDLVAFACHESDFWETASALKRDAEAVRSALRGGEPAYVYLLWGWIDDPADLRLRTRVSVSHGSRGVEIRLRPHPVETVAVTTPATYVGFRVPLGVLPPGEHRVTIVEEDGSERTETFTVGGG